MTILNKTIKIKLFHNNNNTINFFKIKARIFNRAQQASAVQSNFTQPLPSTDFCQKLFL